MGASLLEKPGKTARLRYVPILTDPFWSTELARSALKKQGLFQLSRLGKCVCKGIVLAAIINISSCKTSAEQAWAKQFEFLSFDHLRFPLDQAGRGAREPALQMSPGPLSSACPQNTRPPPPRLSTFVLFTNMLPEFQWVIYSMVPSFSHRGLVAGWLRVQSQQREEKSRAKEFFSTFFFYVSLISLCVSPRPPLPSSAPSLLPPPASSVSFTPLCYTIAQIEDQEGPIGNA